MNGAIDALASVYYPQTATLNDIAPPTQAMDFNGQVLSNIGLNTASTDAVRQDYLTTYYMTSGDAANTYQQISEMVNYVTNNYLTTNYSTTS